MNLAWFFAGKFVPTPNYTFNLIGKRAQWTRLIEFTWEKSRTLNKLKKHRMEREIERERMKRGTSEHTTRYTFTHKNTLVSLLTASKHHFFSYLSSHCSDCSTEISCDLIIVFFNTIRSFTNEHVSWCDKKNN